jgi:hypothetical protein
MAMKFAKSSPGADGTHMHDVFCQCGGWIVKKGAAWLPGDGSMHEREKCLNVAGQVAAELEQKAYRAGWEAGARKTKAVAGKFQKALDDHTGDALAYSMRYMGVDRSRYDDTRLSGVRIGAKTAKTAAPIDLQRMAYESRASSDRAASKAHAEREYWADGIDPDDV